MIEDSPVRKTDLLCVIPCDNKEFLYYEPNHTGGKSVMTMTSFDTIDLNFTDKWGSPLIGMRDFLVEITLDFIRLNMKKEQINLLDVKHVMSH